MAGLRSLVTLLAALSVAACGTPGEESSHARPCGTAGDRIDARELLDVPEQDAIELGRRHGCAVHVEVRDGKVVAPADRSAPPNTTIGVTVRDGYVDRLCVHIERSCRPTRGQDD
jgi:hypothetical protein